MLGQYPAFVNEVKIRLFIGTAIAGRKDCLLKINDLYIKVFYISITR